MTPEMTMDLAYLVMITSAKVAAPFMIAAVLTGVLINILQTVTQIKDQSLTFIPKVVVAAVVTAVMLPYTISVLIGFFNYIMQLFEEIA